MLTDLDQLQAIVESIPDPFFAIDHAGALVYINRHAVAFSGQPVEVAGLLGQRWDAVLPSGPDSPFRQALSRVMHSHDPVCYETQVQGSARWAEVRIYPMAGGAAVHFRDITERRHIAEVPLRLFENLTLGVTYQDPGSRILSANRAAETILGLSLAQLQGRDSMDDRWRAVREDGSDYPGEQHPAMRALRSGQIVQNDLMGVFNPQMDGWRWLSVTAIPDRAGGEGDLRGVYTIFEDITERHQARQALTQSERRYRTLAAATSQYVWTNSPDGRMLGEQPDWQTLTGQTRDEYEGYGWAEALHPDDRAPTVQAWQAAVAARSGMEIEHRVRTAAGEYHTYFVRALPLLTDSGEVSEWIGLHTDVTPLKRAEEQLRLVNSSLEARVEERTRALENLTRFNALLLDAADEGIFGLGPDGRARFANPAAARLLGYAVEELIGAEQHALIHHSRPDGAPYPLAECPIHTTLRGGQPARVEHEVFWRKDGTALPVEYVSAPLRAPDGRIEGAVVLFQDVSERLRARQTLQDAIAELERSNRELEQFAYVASHDLQEPLRTVGSYTDLLARRYAGQLDERADQYLRITGEAVGRMRRLINDLLSYARLGRQTPERRPLDLNVVAQEAVASLSEAIRERGAVVELGPLPTVLGDATQLRQLLGNLLGNALKFTREGAVPEVQIAAELEAEGSWRLQVRDNGIGIAPEYRERVFVIFQRLHHREQYDGTGIGLAVCKKIVEGHGGHIWIEAPPDGAPPGTTIAFTLPAAPTKGPTP